MGKNDDNKSDDILNNLKSFTIPRVPIVNDPTCIDGDTSPEDDEDDENLLIDFGTSPPALSVYQQVVACKNGESYVNLWIEYNEIEGFDYEWKITEVDPGDPPQ